MVSGNPNPAQGFFFFDPINSGQPSLNSLPPTSNYNATTTNTTAAAAASTASTKTASANTMSFSEDPSKKIRKPYTITKSRESWTEQEHDKFLEALQLFDRDWKKIEAFIGSKTVIQIRSHAQKYFLKVQKNGTSGHLPPPRPKRKAAHPYPQKAPKTVHGFSQDGGKFQSSATLLEPGYIYRPDSSSVLGNPIPSVALSSWSHNSVPPVSASQVTKDDVGWGGPGNAPNLCFSNSNDSTPRTCPVGETIDQGDYGKPPRVMPDFARVYSFLGSVFDPTATGHIQRLKKMDPINFETVLLLMRNLAINLTTPEFEDHKRLLSVYDAESERSKFGRLHAGKSESAIPSA